MTGSEGSTKLACPDCGIECPADSKTCWLCRADLSGELPIVVADIVPDSSDSIGDQIFKWLTIACVAFALLIGIGIIQSDRGMLVPYLIFILPAFVATGGRALWSRLRGGKTSGTQLFLTFVGSLAIVAGISTLLVVAAIAGLLVICFSGGVNFR